MRGIHSAVRALAWAGRSRDDILWAVVLAWLARFPVENADTIARVGFGLWSVTGQAKWYALVIHSVCLVLSVGAGIGMLELRAWSRWPALALGLLAIAAFGVLGKVSAVLALGCLLAIWRRFRPEAPYSDRWQRIVALLLVSFLSGGGHVLLELTTGPGYAPGRSYCFLIGLLALGLLTWRIGTLDLFGAAGKWTLRAAWVYSMALVTLWPRFFAYGVFVPLMILVLIATGMWMLFSEVRHSIREGGGTVSARRVVGVLLIIGAVVELGKTVMGGGVSASDPVFAAEARGWLGITVALLCLGLLLLLGGRQQKDPTAGKQSPPDGEGEDGDAS